MWCPNAKAESGGTVHPRPPGRTRDVVAVTKSTSSIEQGEIVGFLGPNGAGKTTTLKMLAGLLHPTAGGAVLGHVPWRRESALPGPDSLVMGQRNQLHWDIPAPDPSTAQPGIYGVPRSDFRGPIDELVDLLDLATCWASRCATSSSASG